MNRTDALARPRRIRQRGMTLIELMVVVTVLALMATAVSISVVKVLSHSKISKAKSDIASLNTALDFYYNIEGDFPSQGEGLNALVTPGPDGKRYLKRAEVVKDPWKQDYQYRYPGTHNADSYDVCSKGPDKAEGTQDDVCN
jgi:general secretion pathway protein G